MCWCWLCGCRGVADGDVEEERNNFSDWQQRDVGVEAQYNEDEKVINLLIIQSYEPDVT